MARCGQRTHTRVSACDIVELVVVDIEEPLCQSQLEDLSYIDELAVHRKVVAAGEVRAQREPLHRAGNGHPVRTDAMKHWDSAAPTGFGRRMRTRYGAVLEMVHTQCHGKPVPLPRRC